VLRYKQTLSTVFIVTLCISVRYTVVCRSGDRSKPGGHPRSKTLRTSTGVCPTHRHACTARQVHGLQVSNVPMMPASRDVRLLKASVRELLGGARRFEVWHRVLLARAARRARMYTRRTSLLNTAVQHTMASQYLQSPTRARPTGQAFGHAHAAASAASRNSLRSSTQQPSREAAIIARKKGLISRRLPRCWRPGHSAPCRRLAHVTRRFVHLKSMYYESTPECIHYVAPNSPRAHR
jgi:hypothetical protein